MNFFALDDSEKLAAQKDLGLRLFLDSADPEVWRHYLPLGYFYGITTNPLLLEKAGQQCSIENLEKLARRAFRLGAREIHLQTWGKTPEEMIHNGSRLALLSNLGGDVCVKIPADENGFCVASSMVKAGSRLTITAVYAQGQVLAAAGLEAAYVAPYYGRLNDAGKNGREQLVAMKKILDSSGNKTRLLAASLRNATDVTDLAIAGLDTFTFGPEVARQLLEEPMTASAAADFQRAAEAMSE